VGAFQKDVTISTRPLPIALLLQVRRECLLCQQRGSMRGISPLGLIWQMRERERERERKELKVPEGFYPPYKQQKVHYPYPQEPPRR
jgi:hypothetical protein